MLPQNPYRMQGRSCAWKEQEICSIVKRIHADKPEAFEPKDILNILDVEPILHAAAIAFMGMDS
jgi:hypothetical protein